MKLIFISHQSDDYPQIKNIVSLVEKCFGNLFTVFNSSSISQGTSLSIGLKEAIDEKMNEAESVFIFATKNYARSEFCLYEASIASYLKKPVYIFNFNQIATDVVLKIMCKNQVYVDCLNHDNLKNEIKKFLNDFSKSHNLDFDMKTVSKTIGSWQKEEQVSDVLKYFIGSDDRFKNVQDYCSKMGIYEFRNSSISMDDLHNHIKDVKKLSIVSTTGYDLISKLSSGILSDLLIDRTEIDIYQAAKDGQFLSEIAKVEDWNGYDKNIERLNNEIDNVKTLVNSVISSLGSECKGTVSFHSINTLIRQTITLVEYKDGTTWGWLLMTIPPNKTRDNTPFFMFENKSVEDGISKLLSKHIASIDRLSSNPLSVSSVNNTSVMSKWNEMYNKAMLSLYENEANEDLDGVLIEVAAQHPLRSNGTPGSEFEKRLNKAIELFNEIKNKGERVKIYIPGSIHDESNVSLSQAGSLYLINHGINEEDIYGDKEQEDIMNANGVYNSFEECYVASVLFNKHQFKKMLVVCSPYQLSRKTLFYISLGLLPEIIPVYCKKMWHSIIKENFEDIPYLLEHYQEFEISNYFGSPLFCAVRKERKIN